MRASKTFPALAQEGGQDDLLDGLRHDASPPSPPSAAAKAEGRGPKAPILKPVTGELSKRQRKLIDDALLIEQEDAQKVGVRGYMSRALVQATLPHSDPKTPLGQMYSRTNGKLLLTVAPTSPRFGIPYGTAPRLIMAWMCTEARVKNSPTLMLGRSQNEFLTRIGMYSNGQYISNLRDQALRLFKSVISIEEVDHANPHKDKSARLNISDQSHIFWHPTEESQQAIWESTLVLSDSFFKEIIDRPIPMDLSVFQALSKSPMSMDIYTWLTYRMFVLRRSGKPFVRIPWVSLKEQFGAGYKDDAQGLYNFKTNFKSRLRDVLYFYPEARDSMEDEKSSACLKLFPCVLHIPTKTQPPPLL